VQDNAAIHRACITRDFLIDNDIAVVHWPAYRIPSYHVENAWNKLKDAIAGIEVESEDAYWELISSTWMNEEIIPTAYLNSLILSTIHRCDEILENKGGAIDY